jgi:uncharacterized protein (TIGR03435 family)
MTSVAFGQAPAVSGAPKLEFEVASVKPAAPMTGGMMRVGMRVDAGRMDYENVSLKDCIRTAWRLKDYQISGPDWMTSARFDIVGKLPEGTTKDQVPEMLQALLAERFKIVVHHDSKLHDSYALVVGKGGPKLTPSAPDDPAGAPTGASTSFGGPSAASGGGAPKGGDAPVGPPQTRIAFSATGGGGGGGGVAMGGGKMGPGSTMKMNIRKQTVTAFADLLARFLASPVVDLTEIQGTYDFILEMSMEDMSRGSGLVMFHGPGAMAGGGADAPSTPDAGDAESGGLFRTVQNYGLKLDKRKVPLDLLVVDHIEKVPTEN